MTIRTFWVALCALPLLLTGCAYDAVPAGTPRPDAANSDPRGTSWVLEDLRGAAPVAGSTVTALFGADGRVSGSAGCNRYQASFTLHGDTLTVGDATSTMMACAPDVMTQETAFLSALKEVRTYAARFDRLELRDASGKAILAFAVTSQDLDGTKWVVTGFNNGAGGVTSPIVDTEVTVAFTGDSVSANAGCNAINGAATFSDGTIKLGPLATTRKMCPAPEGVMQQEQQFAAALEKATSYQIEGDTLRLAEGGATMVTARRG
ncbi:META domain-containing protein [Propioniciclava coleopterorum]|uniref:META domain-containing protein n=1 Tax=Propioniciclava coleopterorum TaxID=2714937 RepID=A0A6G7Y7L5_9ACTN|nr:META domain-containing protein [Propioniciclava coleopterorum]QIK72621.1 META domain-containing protein [Propioniciclava coleopterorum]